MEPREEEKREPQMDPEVTKEQPRLKRFCIVRLEERIAPAAGGNEGKSILVTIFTR